MVIPEFVRKRQEDQAIKASLSYILSRYTKRLTGAIRETLSNSKTELKKNTTTQMIL